MLRQRTGKVMDGLRSPDLPNELIYLWGLYLDIKKGSDCIKWADISHYVNITGNVLSYWEASLMIDVDMVRRKHG